MKQHLDHSRTESLRMRVLVVGFLMATLLFGAESVLAATRTWSGAGGDSNWSTVANWGGTAPVAGDDLSFPDGAAQLTNTNDLAAGTSFNSISFTGPSGGYAISGNGIQLVAGITAVNNTTNFLHIPIQITASQTFNVTGDRLSFASGSIDLGSNTLTLVGSTGVVDSLSATGAGGVTSSAMVVFVGTSTTYTGPTVINDGGFAVAGTSLSTSSVVTINGGFLQFANSGSAGPITVNSPATLRCEGGGANQIGNITDLTMYAGSNLTMAMYALSNYGQLNASGNVSLGDATLNLQWSFASATGNAFTIINKTGPGAVTGTFNGLAEGATFIQNGRTYRITYIGGDGNDVVVTDITGLPPAAITPVPTLSQWGLLLLVAAIPLVGFAARLRGRSS